MSQHRIQTVAKGEPVSVMMGWDRPLQRFFLGISKVAPTQLAPGASTENTANDDDDSEESLYESLDDMDLAPIGTRQPTFEYFMVKLTDLSVLVPGSFLEQIALDGVNNAGNRWVDHGSTFNADELKAITDARAALTARGINPDELDNIPGTGPDNLNAVYSMGPVWLKEFIPKGNLVTEFPSQTQAARPAA